MVATVTKSAAKLATIRKDRIDFRNFFNVSVLLGPMSLC